MTWWRRAGATVVVVVTGVSVGVVAAGSAAAPDGTLIVRAAPVRTAPARPSPARTAPPGPASVGRAVETSTPRQVRIPAIGVAATVGRLGLRADGTVEVPADPATTGWFEPGPRPGERGSSVILGHVDSVSGPAVFARLGSLGPGDRVDVGLDDGEVARFVVDAVRLYTHDTFPARRVYARQGHHALLNLVTCGGVYDAQRGGYQANVVVFTTLLRRLSPAPVVVASTGSSGDRLGSGHEGR